MRHSRKQARGWQRARDIFAALPEVGARFWGTQSQSSNTGTVSPFGDLPYKQAGGLSGQFTNPLSAFFGIAPTRPKALKRYNNQMQAIEDSDGPLASFMEQAGAFLPGVFDQASGVGENIASMAPGLFDLIRSQVGGALDQLPGLQQAAGQQRSAAEQAATGAGNAVGTAQGYVDQANSPISSQALFQDALRNALEGTRAGANARGLLGGGDAQATEETMGRDLAAQYAQQQFGNQQGALGGLLAALTGQQGALGGARDALGNEAGLLSMGPSLAGMPLDALPGLQQAMAAGYQMPMEALNAVFQMIAAGQNPQLALLGQTAPQIGQWSSGHGYNVL